MSKTVDINHTFIKTPVRITVDGINYPLTGWNIEVIKKYWLTDDESVLDNLKNFVLDLS